MRYATHGHATHAHGLFLLCWPLRAFITRWRSPVNLSDPVVSFARLVHLVFWATQAMDEAAANAKKIAEQRLKENAQLRAEIETLKQSELRAKRDSAMAGMAMKDAAAPSNQQGVHQQLASEKRYVEDERDRLRRDLDMTRNEIRQLYALDDERNGKLEKVLDNYKAEFAKLKADRDKARLELETSKAVGISGQRQLVRESEKIMESLREENSSYKEQVQKLRQQLQTKSNPSSKLGSESLQKLKARIYNGSLSGTEKDQNLKLLITEVMDQWETIEGSKETEEILIQEIDSTGQSLEKAQERNTALLQQLNEKQEALSEVVSSKMRADQAHKLSREKASQSHRPLLEPKILI